MSVIDGKAIASESLAALKVRVSALSSTPRLSIVQIGDDKASSEFVARKKDIGEKLGIDVRVHNYDESISTTELRKRLSVLAHERGTDGIILQLPLPENLNTEYLLNAIPPEKDVDALSSKSIGSFSAGKMGATPPVVSAAQKLLNSAEVVVRGKRCVVIGAGRLVGKPLAAWLMNEGAILTVVGEPSDKLASLLADADVVFLGSGSPHLVNATMLKAGAVVIDAGSGISDEGMITGDFDSNGAEEKGITYSPVPGGVGPLTVVALFENLLILVEKG